MPVTSLPSRIGLVTASLPVCACDVYFSPMLSMCRRIYGIPAHNSFICSLTWRTKVPYRNFICFLNITTVIDNVIIKKCINYRIIDGKSTLQENSAKLTNQRVSCAFTSSPVSFHMRHILPTSKFQNSYSCILLIFLQTSVNNMCENCDCECEYSTLV